MTTEDWFAADPPTDAEFEQILDALVRTGVEHDVDVEGAYAVWEDGGRTGWEIQVTRIER